MPTRKFVWYAFVTCILTTVLTYGILNGVWG